MHVYTHIHAFYGQRKTKKTKRGEKVKVRKSKEDQKKMRGSVGASIRDLFLFESFCCVRAKVRFSPAFFFSFVCLFVSSQLLGR
ncbi:hypothetical protein TRSC58_07262 [Trypanosoma rangeli SC58]|uniref:Uncharacterized protein n=1 Tax=Trypanosoma rangeli SC58 TaxID=429131 RepID=A0A061IS55_TRYRA|nr:hypothetical protein TRSC58_07262 [Trypanosoma rangeli SC58]